jgi:hypothetical protein
MVFHFDITLTAKPIIVSRKNKYGGSSVQFFMAPSGPFFMVLYRRAVLMRLHAFVSQARLSFLFS